MLNQYYQSNMDSSVQKPTVIYLLGGPGSGKGTQCAKILQNHPNKFYHISTGSLLREASKVQTPENLEIQKLMKQGKMVPSSYLIRLIKAKIFELGSSRTYILDGFPRNVQNLELWSEIMKDDVHVAFLLYLSCTDEEMRNRLTQRAKTSGRADDNPETIELRIKAFNNDTIPMLNKYKSQNKRIIYVSSSQTIENVGKDVQKVLLEQKLA